MVSIEKRQSSSAVFSQYLLTALTAVGTLLILGWLLKYSAYGIDFTDESFYLVWISNPFIYAGSITQFGFIYHPLYVLLDGDIAALRQANILITFGLAWALVYFFLGSLVNEIKQNRSLPITVAAGLATSSLILFESWLPTPSYNSLALQSLLISAIGLVLAEKVANRTSMIGWVLIGVGGWLAFMAKPSTAAALAVGVFIYLLLSRKISTPLILVASVSTLLLLLASALLIEGSVFSFVERLQLGVELSRLLDGGYALSQLLRIDSFHLGIKFQLAILLFFGALLIALWCAWEKNRKWSFISLLISLGLFALTALLTLGQIHRAAGFGKFQGLLIFSLIYAAAFSALMFGRIKALTTITASQWVLACLFLAMPHIYAFGTNGNYWQAGSSAAIFWLLAGLTMSGPLIRERASWVLTLLALAAQAVTATLIQSGLEQPYRQPEPLRLNASTLEIGPQNSALVVSEDYAEYIATAMATAQKAGFEPNTPLIDLSGQSPGILYAVGAQSIGQAWTIGGYPGSLKLAEVALARTSCEKIATAWVLFEQGGPRSIPTELMHSLGADFPSNYNQVGTWQTAEGSGGYAARRTQELYKPIWSQKTLITCQKLRTKVTQ
ncbi:hypothetical protein [Stutzerimonas nitrititolerans]|uniref:hypothetical protein n=1 Tax=Stutzerimonas nitrititolerans TaxID=2482751 RepID=UPI00289ADEC7|nr:hypothetical protein [Stutzerimonas nitrititolerans]